MQNIINFITYLFLKNWNNSRFVSSDMFSLVSTISSSDSNSISSSSIKSSSESPHKVLVIGSPSSFKQRLF